METCDEIGDKEAELYDRQLRLWGFEAQRRMQQSKILLCGVTGLHIETAKNLVLAGIHVTVQDSGNLTPEDLSALYFAKTENIGQNRASVVQPLLQALNAFVTVDCETRPIDELPDEYYAKFTCVVVTKLSDTEAVRLNLLARNNKASFFLCDSYGDEGWFIADLGSHFTFQHDPPRSSTIETFCYPSLSEVFETKWKDCVKKHFPLSKTFVVSRIVSTFRDTRGRCPAPGDAADIATIATTLLKANDIPVDFISDNDISNLICLTCWGQLMPVCSIVGGFLSQEVVKAVSAVGVPMMNVFVFSLADGVGKAFCTAPLGTTVLKTATTHVSASLDIGGNGDGENHSTKRQKVEVEVL